MNQYLKILLVGLVAWGIAVTSSYLLLPQSAMAKAEYEVEYNELKSKEAKYNELKSKDDITKEDKDQLEVLFRDFNEDKEHLEVLFRALNSEENIKSDLISIGIKYGLFLLLLIPVIIWIARSINMKNNAVIASSGLIFLSFILVGSAVVGGVFAALFCVVGIAFKKTGQEQVT